MRFAIPIHHRRGAGELDDGAEHVGGGAGGWAIGAEDPDACAARRLTGLTSRVLALMRDGGRNRRSLYRPDGKPGTYTGDYRLEGSAR